MKKRSEIMISIKKYPSYQIIILSCFIICIILTLTYNLLNKKNIFPKKSERYDITEIYIGLTRDLCGFKNKKELYVKDYENCIRTYGSKKPEKKLFEFKIPTLNEIMNTGIPSFGGTLKTKNEKLNQIICNTFFFDYHGISIFLFKKESPCKV